MYTVKLTYKSPKTMQSEQCQFNNFEGYSNALDFYLESCTRALSPLSMCKGSATVELYSDYANLEERELYYKTKISGMHNERRWKKK